MKEKYEPPKIMFLSEREGVKAGLQEACADGSAAIVDCEVGNSAW